MTLVLDSGAISALAERRALLHVLRDRGQWPPHVPAVVLTEALAGDPHRDHSANRFLATCLVSAVEEPVARRAAKLRATSTRRSASAVDAVIVATAEALGGATVLTTDRRDIAALAANAVDVIVGSI